ncbi:putative ABC transporter ATP-binding protein [mine drainage metagenome]|uniref:Putative ABC transporter ATP-binding protein n=1 Tax=mine drainage metagenome TaxID=410659 RepID=A0A1J5T512_9ZZZZ
MDVSTISPPSSDSPIPDAWHQVLQARLADRERIHAWFETDLDDRLSFSKGLLLVTDRRVLALTAAGQGCSEHRLAAGQTLRQQDHAGIGSIGLFDGGTRLGCWRYTMAHGADATRFVRQFEQALNGLQGGHPAGVAQPRLCPLCLAPLAPDQEECAYCDIEAEAPPSSWVLLRLWRFARPYRWQLLAGFLLMLASTAATLVPPYLSMPLMDDVLIPFENGKPINVGMVELLLGGLLLSALLAWALGWAKTYILALVSERIGTDLRTITYDHLLHLSLEYFGGKRTGDLMARIGSESDRICLFLSLHLLDFATDVLMILMTAVILFTIDPWLALVTLLPLPLIAWMIHQVRHRLSTGFEKVDRVWSQVSNILADTIPGIRVVKAFAQEKRESGRFRQVNQHNLAVNDRINRIWSLFSPSVTLLTEIGLLVVWAFGIWQVTHNRISVGVLTAFLAYISRFYTRLDSMSRIVSVTQKTASGAKRIFDILDRVSSVPEPAKPQHLERIEGRIDIRDAGFRYGNRAVIRNFNLTIAPGEMIGLVGHSGSGKSTLVNLLCRFYDVSEGAISIDGVNIRSLPIAEYRSNIGLVLQEPFLFFGSIAENIAYGKPHATRTEIVAAARAAHAHEFILRLPHGYDSLVGERGQGLSGGERQRISIARALLIDPRILILDEATASVDTETEKEIQRALDNLVRGRTTIAIAHRLSTLHKADRLVVLDRGEIVEMGSHEELMGKEGAYFRLYQAQARNVDTDLDDQNGSPPQTAKESAA